MLNTIQKATYELIQADARFLRIGVYFLYVYIVINASYLKKMHLTAQSIEN